MNNTQAGFTVLEVLLALFILAIGIGSIVNSNVQLAQINSRAQIQSVESNVAEAAADQLAQHANLNVTGRVLDYLPLTDLTEQQRAIAERLDFSIQPEGIYSVIKIYRNDVTNDPNAVMVKIDQTL